jgi:hypothetical protein
MRRLVAAGSIALVSILGPVLAQAPAKPIILSVEASGPLPGFRPEDAIHYLAEAMSGQSGWRFVTQAPSASLPRDRIEWRFELDPYAGGGVRQFFPMAQMRQLFGARHRVSAEARLYLDGQYQTLVFGQATIQGGADDKELAAFVARMTNDLLGEHGAYRAIDLTPPSIPHS